MLIRFNIQLRIAFIFCLSINCCDLTKILNAHISCTENEIWDLVCTVENYEKVDNEINFDQGYKWTKTEVLFEQCHMQTIPKFTFNVFQEIKVFNVPQCSMTYLYQWNFEGADHLKTLKASDNNLRTISAFTFEFAINLETLDLQNNEILDLDVNSFTGAEKLRKINFNNNRIKFIPYGIFENLTSLRILSMARNFIEVIESGLFQHNPRIFDLKLNSNRMKLIEPDALIHLDLTSLYLGGNQITELEIGSATYLDVSNCRLKALKIHRSIEILRAQENRISELLIGDKTMAYDFQLKNNQLSNFWNLTGAHKLRILDISQNPIEFLNVTSFRELPKIEFLNLSSTQLANIDSEALTPLKHLSELDISGNTFHERQCDEIRGNFQFVTVVC